MKKILEPSLKTVPLSLLFYALSDPARITIVLMLLEVEEISCGQCKIPLSKSTLSHHFKVLRESGLLQKREEGKIHYISLRRKEIEKRMPGFLEMLMKMRKPL